MLRSQKIREREQNQIRRGGLLYFGALREFLVITLAVGLVTTCIWQANALMSVQLASQNTESPNKDVMPVMSLAINEEQLTLFTHSLTGKLRQISLDTGILTSRPAPTDLIAVAMSAKASTIAMLEEWAEDRRIHHRVDVVANDQIILSEELNFEPYSDVNVQISSDSNVVMSFSSQGMGIGWDLSESVPRRWTINVGPIGHTNSLSPDGHRLVVSSKNGPPFICDSQTGDSRISLSQVEKSCQCVTWSADGNRLSIGDYGGGIHVFNALTGERIWHDKLSFEFPRSVAFSSDGEKLAVGGFDEIIRIWDLSRPDQQPIQLKGQQGIIRSLVFVASNENLISGSLNGTIFEWSLATQTFIRQIQ